MMCWLALTARGFGIAFEGDYDLDDYGEVVADIQRVCEDVWERGTFWVATQNAL